MTTPNQPCVKRRDVRGVLLLIAAFRSSADDSSSETKNRPCERAFERPCDWTAARAYSDVFERIDVMERDDIPGVTVTPKAVGSAGLLLALSFWL
jgi:hypothetical protein